MGHNNSKSDAAIYRTREPKLDLKFKGARVGPYVLLIWLILALDYEMECKSVQISS
jgi:hypothetical protein